MRTEQKLDWTLVRKKAEINDSLGRPLKVNGHSLVQVSPLMPQVKRTLRVFVSNTAHDQQWQRDMESTTEQPDVNTGKGIAGWVLRVEGRLLDVRIHVLRVINRMRCVGSPEVGQRSLGSDKGQVLHLHSIRCHRIR
jgi:hypothetical protein